MTLGTPGRPAPALLAPLVVALLALVATLLVLAPPAQAATVSVPAARATQNGSAATVRGYVVGHPTSSTTAVRGPLGSRGSALAGAVTDVDSVPLGLEQDGAREIDFGVGGVAGWRETPASGEARTASCLVFSPARPGPG